MKKFDASIPRKMYWSDKVPNKYRCPHCKTKLEKDYQSYVFAIWIKGEYQAFICGNEAGAFCPQCPIVVLNQDDFISTIDSMDLANDGGRTQIPEFAVVGIVDTNAIQKENADMPIGADDNPIPLVEFIDEIEGGIREQGIPRKGKRLSGNQRRRRNRI
jgi:hypothetical protein